MDALIQFRMPRGILFDFFNTLQNSQDSSRREIVRRMGADIGVDPEAFADLFADTWPDRMTGALGDLPHQVRTLAGRLGADPSAARVAVAVERRMAFSRHMIAPSEPVIDLLGRFRRAGWRIAVVSNCTIDSAAAIRDGPVGEAVDALILSCEVKLAKPDPAIYRLACEAIGMLAEECVFVGDGADGELPGAQAIGLRVIQTTQFASKQRGWTGERVAHLTDLLPLLDV